MSDADIPQADDKCSHPDGFTMNTIELLRRCSWCGFLAPGEREEHSDPVMIARVVINRGYASPREAVALAQWCLECCCPTKEQEEASLRLQVYLELERAMMALDDVGDAMADALRDTLDPIWHALSDEEKAFLNHRRPHVTDDGH